MQFNIYRITNTANSKSYVGSTIFSLEERFHGHVMKAMNPNGIKNGSLFDLHLEIRKLGAEMFAIDLVEAGDGEKNIMYSRESYWIRQYQTMKPYGYNVRFRVLADEQIAVIRYDILGLTITEYAKLFNVSPGTIATAKYGRGCGYKEDPYSYITREHIPLDTVAFLANFSKQA